MRILSTKILSAVALSTAMFLTSLAPAAAFTPIPTPKPVQTASSDVTQIQYRRDERRLIRRGYERRSGGHYYNGHRGYSERRPGYRRHNGAWFPLAAFATGAIIGGAVSADRPVRYGGSHVEWCQNRYRSYRAYDNSYQPNSGPRRECNSPY